MKEVEVAVPLQLSDAEAARVALHSFHNVLNIIVVELQLLRRLVKEPAPVARSQGVCQELVAAFRNRECALAQVDAIEGYRAVIEADVAAAIASGPVGAREAELLEESEAQLRRVLNVVDVRVREILARQEAPGRWQSLPIAEIRSGLEQVFRAIAAGARGRYRIVFSPTCPAPDTYAIDFQLAGVDGDTICMPPVLVDCLRDLTANARKYSLPGTCIEACLEENADALELAVRDGGRGIPEGELDRVVLFGHRACNALPNETMGGGYGLTKAYYVARQHGGRMWIASGLGQGTAIRLVIPRTGVDAGSR